MLHDWKRMHVVVTQIGDWDGYILYELWILFFMNIKQRKWIVYHICLNVSYVYNVSYVSTHFACIVKLVNLTLWTE